MLKTLDRLSEMLEALSVTTAIPEPQRQVGREHPRLKRRGYTSLASQVSASMVPNSSPPLVRKASYSPLDGPCAHWSVWEELAIRENDLISEVPAEP